MLRYFLFISIFISHIGFSQIYIYYPDSTSGNVAKPKEPSHKHFSLCINPTYVFRGMLGLYSEFTLNNKYSFRIGAGGTYRDFFYEADVLNNDLSKLPDTVRYAIYKEKTNPGYFVDLDIKKYPFKHAEMEGMYVSTGFRFRKYFVTDSKTTQNFNLNYYFVEPNLKIGYSIKNHHRPLYLDFYTGVAYSYFERNGYETTNKIHSPITYKKSTVKPLFGIIAGYIF